MDLELKAVPGAAELIVWLKIGMHRSRWWEGVKNMSTSSEIPMRPSTSSMMCIEAQSTAIKRTVQLILGGRSGQNRYSRSIDFVAILTFYGPRTV